jgi:hypothetical protein
MFQPMDIGQIPTTQFNIPAPKPKGGGMFGGGGKKALSVIAEAMAAYAAGMGNPGGMAVLQGMNHRRQSAADAETQEQQYQRQRMDSRDDYLWKRDNTPQNPHYFEDNTGNMMAIGPDGQPQMIYKDPNPFKLVPNGMGGVVPVNMEELMRGYKPAPSGVTFTPIEEEEQGGPRPLGAGGFPGSF